MRITQGMMKPSNNFSALNTKKNKKPKTMLQKLMDQKKKVSDKIKALNKEGTSGTEKSKQLAQLEKQLKALDESIKLEKQKEQKKKEKSKKTMENPKLKVALIKSEAFNIMLSGNSRQNRDQGMMSQNVKNINQMLAMKKLSMYKKHAVS